MSSIIRAIRGIWPYRFPVSQVAISFLLAGLNWAAITLWVRYIFSPSLGTIADLTLRFSFGPIGLFLWPLFLSIVVSMTFPVAFPERTLIAPFDVNVLTIGIFAITLWNDLGARIESVGVYILYLLMLGVVLLPVGLAQTSIALRFLGFQGFEEDLSKQLFETSLDMGTVTSVVLSRSKGKSLGLVEAEELEDKTVVLHGQEHGFDYYLAMSPMPKGQGSLVCILATEFTSFGLKKPDGDWFDGKCSAVTTVLEELKLRQPPQRDRVLPPRSVVDSILQPTKGLLHRFREMRTALLWPAIIVLVLSLADYWFYLTKTVDQNTAVFIGFTIAVYAVGLSIASRRRVLKRP